MLNLLMIAGGLLLLVYGANRLVDGASALAGNFRVSNMVIGLTIVALGTSTPELFVNLMAALEQNTQIVFGNVMGSNISNIFLILGISALIYPLSVRSNTTWVEIPLGFLASLVILAMGSDVWLDHTSRSVITRSEGIVLLGFFAIFIGYSLHLLRAESLPEEILTRKLSTGRSVFFIVLGLVLLIVGGRFIVNGAVELAETLGVPERIIALTIVSLGTSLPELATSVAAVRKRNVDMAIGNVVGSNIFNIFFVLGVSSVVYPVEIPEGGMLDFATNILAGLLLFVFIFVGKGRQLVGWEGMLFLLVYALYMILLFTRF
jgi:cation:H+ antiporter